MTTSIPFGGLAPDSRRLRGAGDLAAFDAQSAVRIGRELRRRADGGELSTVALATALLDALNAFEHQQRPACVLVRAFVTRRFDELPPELQAGGNPDATYLRLLATRGLEPDWNEEAKSRHHRTLPLAAPGTPALITELARQLRQASADAPPATSFHVTDPLGNAAVPDKTFVTAYEVRSVVGFGVRPWAGEVVVVVLFARAEIERGVRPALETLGLYTKLAWLSSSEARQALAAPALLAARAAALDDIVTAHEDLLEHAVRDWKQAVAGARAEAQRAAEAEAEQLEAHNQALRRTQRVMLNLIEDLRDAREGLATKVEERTRELAAANTILESRNRELEEFAYIASHDLQEPLRTVAGYLQLVERRYSAKLGPDGDEFIRFAVEGAQRMQALIDSLLLYSRVANAPRAFAPLALDEALDVAMRNLALRLSDTGACVERSPLPTVHADRTQMVQLFQNLLSNAIKFAGDRAPRVHVSASSADGLCTLSFRDEGIGFDPKYSDRIFKIFRRLRRDTAGTGIGLSICKKIVERHGGKIEARSQPGQGATFLVQLPLAPATGGGP
jgi:signal transduction histidine kinase